MKTYITPAMQVTETQVRQMMAQSFAINDTEVDGSEALTKYDNAWDIWD